MEKIKDLVSVCVVTYNAEKVITETLDSIAAQSYENIELIVSDDCSKDNTIYIVSKWIEKHKKRFKNIEFLKSLQNTGVTGNCNRACRQAKGEFIKLIGDDILLTDFVTDCVNYFHTYPNDEVLFTRIRLLDAGTKEIVDDDKHDYDFFKLSVEEQFQSIIQNLGLYIPTCSSFYRTETLEKMDFFDESIPMWEDGPMYFKLVEHHIHLSFLDKIDVLYRINMLSLSHSYSIYSRRSRAVFYLKYFYHYDKEKNHIKANYRFIKNLLLASNNKLIERCIYLYRKMNS